MENRIKISNKWMQRIRSSSFSWGISACTGISQSFCLFFIYKCGESHLPIYHPFVLLNVAIIWFVSWYYSGIAFEVISQVRRPTDHPR